MSRFLIVATGGAGGDLPPLIAAAQALRERGHETSFIGDAAVDRALSGLGLEVQVLPAELNLGPRLASAVREAMTTTGGDLKAAGPRVEGALGEWGREVARPVGQAVVQLRPDAAVTSLFGVEVMKEADLSSPWAVVNSTFYVGPNPPRPVEEDIGSRAIPLILRYARLIEAADMVLHATDPVFDFSFDRLPARHHYVSRLGHEGTLGGQTDGAGALGARSAWGCGAGSRAWSCRGRGARRRQRGHAGGRNRPGSRLLGDARSRDKSRDSASDDQSAGNGGDSSGELGALNHQAVR